MDAFRTVRCHGQAFGTNGAASHSARHGAVRRGPVGPVGRSVRDLHRLAVRAPVEHRPAAWLRCLPVSPANDTVTPAGEGPETPSLRLGEGSPGPGSTPRDDTRRPPTRHTPRLRSPVLPSPKRRPVLAIPAGNLWGAVPATPATKSVIAQDAGRGVARRGTARQAVKSAHSESKRRRCPPRPAPRWPAPLVSAWPRQAPPHANSETPAS